VLGDEFAGGEEVDGDRLMLLIPAENGVVADGRTADDEVAALQMTLTMASPSRPAASNVLGSNPAQVCASRVLCCVCCTLWRAAKTRSRLVAARLRSGNTTMPIADSQLRGWLGHHRHGTLTKHGTYINCSANVGSYATAVHSLVELGELQTLVALLAWRTSTA